MDKENRQASDVSIYIVAAIIPFLVTMIAWPLYKLVLGDKALDANEFGDAFGVANSVISALAFAAIYIAIRLQKRDIDLQYEALQQSIAEMKATAESSRELADAQKLANQLALMDLERSYAERMDELCRARREGRYKTPVDDSRLVDLAESLIKTRHMLNKLQSIQNFLTEEQLTNIFSLASVYFKYAKDLQPDQASQYAQQLAKELKQTYPYLDTRNLTTVANIAPNHNFIAGFNDALISVLERVV